MARAWRGETYAACALALALAGCSSRTSGAGSSRIGGPRATTQTSTSAALPAGSGLAVPKASTDPHVIQTSKPGLEGTAGTGLKDGQCAKQNIVTSRVVPTIWLVLDGSGSMLQPLSAMTEQTRWSALTEALMEPNTGVVKSLEKDVEWGVVLYDGPLPGGIALPTPLPDGGVKELPPATTCPRVVVSEPKKNAYADISMVVGADPLGGSTPTDKALNVV